jgi:hypothetical protein
MLVPLPWLSLLYLVSIALLLTSAVRAASPLGESLKDIEVAPHWIYDDLPAAIAEAKRSGKPLLVVLRCVPCPPGRDLDVQIMRPDENLHKIEEQFVCVRLIQTNGLDLDVFQYDYDMSWAAMFLNADMTVYGRYGTRAASGPESDAHLSIPGFRKAAERALELHRGYPDNKEQLAKKTGKAAEYARPELTPGLKDRPRKATERQQCIHCHMVKEFALRARWEDGRLSRDDLFLFPMPQQIGLEIDDRDGRVVKRVIEDSPAATSGIKAGDEVLSVGGQPIVSVADMQWALNSAPDEVELPITLRRGDRRIETKVTLSGDWKKSDIAWRASSWYGLRQGVKFEALSEADKKQRGIDADGLALVVKGLYGEGGPKVQAAGLQMNDLIVAVDDKTDAMTESEFLTYLRLEHGPKDSVKLTVRRGDARHELEIPMW